MALSYRDISDVERQRFTDLYEAKKNKLKEYYENVGSTFRLRNRIESELNGAEARQTRQQTKVITEENKKQLEEKKKAIEQEEKLAVTKAALIENTLLSEIALLKTKYDKE